jgi:hypothetical protein
LLSVVCLVQPSCRQCELLHPRLAASKTEIFGLSVVLPVPKARAVCASTSLLLSELSASSFYSVCRSATPAALAVAERQN